MNGTKMGKNIVQVANQICYKKLTKIIKLNILFQLRKLKNNCRIFIELTINNR